MESIRQPLANLLLKLQEKESKDAFIQLLVKFHLQMARELTFLDDFTLNELHNTLSIPTLNDERAKIANNLNQLLEHMGSLQTQINDQYFANCQNDDEDEDEQNNLFLLARLIDYQTNTLSLLDYLVNSKL